jgi:hypothetical protein
MVSDVVLGPCSTLNEGFVPDILKYKCSDFFRVTKVIGGRVKTATKNGQRANPPEIVRNPPLQL